MSLFNLRTLFVSLLLLIFLIIPFVLRLNKDTSNKTGVTNPRMVPDKVVKIPGIKWGAYVGDAKNDLADFENLVGKKTDLYADFESWSDNFPLELSSQIGQKNKTLIVFWEPHFGYDRIINGSQDNYIKKFAKDAKLYGFPVILVPFPEMNLNENAWGYGVNSNTSAKFKTAWWRVRNIFSDAKNVKFGIAFNNVSIPDISGNLINDYYPGNSYVDYVGVDGFNFGDPWLTFDQIFDKPMQQLTSYQKPIYIFSMASVTGDNKAAWIKEGLGSHLAAYPGIAGWIWFNQSGNPNWQVNSDPEALAAFRSILE